MTQPLPLPSPNAGSWAFARPVFRRELVALEIDSRFSHALFTPSVANTVADQAIR